MGKAVTTKQICIGLACLLTAALAVPAVAKVIRGTDEQDRIQGTSGNDRLYGEGKDDRIDGLGGNDFIDGGTGDDTLNGGPGDDRILGQSGQDRIDGGAGNDVIDGGTGGNVIVGGPGRDRIDGGRDSDEINVRDGERDVVLCGSGKNNRVIADAIDDVGDDCEFVNGAKVGGRFAPDEDGGSDGGDEGSDGGGRGDQGSAPGGGDDRPSGDDDSGGLKQTQGDDRQKPDGKRPERSDGKGGGQGISETDDGDDVTGEPAGGSDEDGDDDGGVPIWLIVLVVIGLVLGGLAGRAFMRRRAEAG